MKLSRKNEIKVISNNEKKIFTYDLEGNFLFDENLEIFGNLFADLGDQRFVYIDNNYKDLSGKNNLIVYEDNEIS
ncbi:6-bladed beta-propeller [uncultured Salegentibacter sp.]|uniref:6-bladed beta-propeller n=1 Tax=uncultured Salegentibacter sp. TaxID=259320 RepID=UPI0030DB939F